jgi:GTPase SAR1 family protein
MKDNLSIEEMRKRIVADKERMREQLANGGNGRLRECWPRWEHLLDDLLEQVGQAPDVSISLVGGMGTGKTTLINALLGARVLPTSGNRACTSAVCEVGHAADGRYHAEVNFLSRAEWEEEAERLRAELARSTSAGGEAPPPESAEFASQALQKLRAIHALNGSGETQAILAEPRPVPPEIARALDAGREEFHCDRAEEFRDRVEQYLSSAHRFWPIVRSVRIDGPFPALASGARLVDLPGLNDPNEAREQVTRDKLKHCKFIWVVYNGHRPPGRDVGDQLLAGEFFRELFLDGRTERLAFIATAADNLDPDETRRDHKLPEDAPLADVLAEQKKAVRAALVETLATLVARLAAKAEDQEERSWRLASRLASPTLFMVSAKDFLALNQRSRTRLMETVEQTELPALEGHLKEVAARYGLESHLAGIERERQRLLAEIESETRAQKLRLEQQRELTAQQREEVIRASTEALGFLEVKLGEFRTCYALALRESQKELQGRFRLGIERGRREVTRTLTRWDSMHHNTLKAVCARGGHHTTTRGPFDLPMELAEPLLDTIAFAWDDFFGERLGQVMREWYENLRHLAAQNAETFRTALSSRLGDRSHLRREMQQMQQATERVLTEQAAQSRSRIQQLIEETRGELHDRIPGRIRDAMREAFLAAGEESGAGMKQRMMDSHLRPAALKVARDVYTDAQQEIEERVRGLQDQMARTYSEMTDTVLRHARMAADNFMQTVHRHHSLEGIDKELPALEGVLALLDSCRSGRSA